MFDKIKSTCLVIVIFVQKMLDILHRYLFGLPILKRSEITANLYLGSQYNLIGISKLKALGITAIVNMRMHSVYTKAQYQGITYLHLPTVDNTPPSLDILLQGAKFVDTAIKAGGKAYVHCRQGLGRGPTMAIAYLIYTGANFDDAFKLVKRVRTFIKPRPGQIERLKELETYCRNAEKASATSK